MLRDKRTARLVGKCLSRLRSRGAHAAEIGARPLRIDGSFFHRRVRGISRDASGRLHAALLEGGLIGKRGTQDEGLLLDDPRVSAWREAVRAASRDDGGSAGGSAGGHLGGGLGGGLGGHPSFSWEGGVDELTADRSAISEELNVAWAEHEIISDHMGPFSPYNAPRFCHMSEI